MCSRPKNFVKFHERSSFRIGCEFLLIMPQIMQACWWPMSSDSYLMGVDSPGWKRCLEKGNMIHKMGSRF
jgi:hypothetical protein